MQVTLKKPATGGAPIAEPELKPESEASRLALSQREKERLSEALKGIGIETDVGTTPEDLELLLFQALVEPGHLRKGKRDPVNPANPDLPPAKDEVLQFSVDAGYGFTSKELAEARKLNDQMAEFARGKHPEREDAFVASTAPKVDRQREIDPVYAQYVVDQQVMSGALRLRLSEEMPLRRLASGQMIPHQRRILG